MESVEVPFPVVAKNGPLTTWSAVGRNTSPGPTSQVLWPHTGSTWVP